MDQGLISVISVGRQLYPVGKYLYIARKRLREVGTRKWGLADCDRKSSENSVIVAGHFCDFVWLQT
jgi:hypothetical protein